MAWKYFNPCHLWNLWFFSFAFIRVHSRFLIYFPHHRHHWGTQILCLIYITFTFAILGSFCSYYFLIHFYPDHPVILSKFLRALAPLREIIYFNHWLHRFHRFSKSIFFNPCHLCNPWFFYFLFAFIHVYSRFLFFLFSVFLRVLCVKNIFY